MTEDRLLTRAEVSDRVGIKTTTIYRMMRKGQFPLPRKIGPRAVRWSMLELEEWIEAQPRASGRAD